jgi:guanylate kinase
MTKLVIVSGPSGVGKNTLVDAVLAQYPKIQYFKKDTARDKRPDDRDTEANFLTNEEYDERRAKHRIALPYEVRGKGYGLPVESFAELKDDPRIVCLSNFDLITSLRDAFDTTTVYVKAPVDAIKNRLTLRQDTDEQRRRSIESVEPHLLGYENFRDLFDYEITNGVDLQAAQEKMIEVIKEEVLPHRRMYNFLLPSNGETQWSAQHELDNEIGSVGDLKALPTYDEIEVKLNDAMQSFYFGSGIVPVGHVIMHGPVTVAFYAKKDRERDNVECGSFELQGPKNDLAKTGALLEQLFPELQNSKYRQVRMEDS